MTRIDERRMDDAGLDALFSEARAAAPEPSAALMARIMADAETTLAVRTALAIRPVGRVRAKVSHWANFVRGLGGWPALAGMATAAVAGIGIGFATPDSLSTLSGGLLLPASSVAMSYELEDLLPGYGSFATLAEEVQG